MVHPVGCTVNIENVSANQTLRKQSFFLISAKYIYLVEDVELFLPDRFRQIMKRFQRSQKCLSQSEAGRTSWIPDQPKKHKLGRGR